MLTATHRHHDAASCAETCTDGYLSLRPEIECPGCSACTPTECPRPGCGDHAYFAAGAHPGCVSCGYVEDRDDCAGCSAPLPEDDALVVEIDETEKYCVDCGVALVLALESLIPPSPRVPRDMCPTLRPGEVA